MDGLLVWAIDRADVAGLVSTTWFGKPPVLLGGEVIRPDYRRNYLVDGSEAPVGLSIACLASKDNGRSFQYRSHAALAGKDGIGLSEPDMAATPEGELVCVMRPGSKSRSMLIAYSGDSGHRWTQPKPFLEYGVLPELLTLGCGAMVLSYGRPGVKAAISADGSGRKWSEPLTVLQSPSQNDRSYSDGYTAMVALDDTRFLLAYSDFQWRNDDGEKCKAILVREGRIRA
jgi:hypothetical protein